MFNAIRSHVLRRRTSFLFCVGVCGEESIAVITSQPRPWKHSRQQWLQRQNSAAPPKHFRQELKENKKRGSIWGPADTRAKDDGSTTEHEEPSDWELSVGIEIHAQLNTTRKLFSEAKTSNEDYPNKNTTFYDLAYPGTQPNFQPATLIPAIRAALALNCDINRESYFDRKHYFYQDQPAGYQITQYYKPFAVNGHLILSDQDDANLSNGNAIRIGIRQVQLEQDTAKSTMQDQSLALLDFNRVGHPLIEVITLPDIHSTKAASACIRKILFVLRAVNAVTAGMELGGLRADVNVSVARSGSANLGQRVEIKNLNTLQSVEAAIAAEQRRQIRLLESGETVMGETRGWSLGSTESVRLRGKEGEVDYRYMPDPDIPPLLIGEDLIQHISDTLPQLPETIVNELVQRSGLTLKDAKTLSSLDDGARLHYFDAVKDELHQLLVPSESAPIASVQHFDRLVANWILHELGHLLTTYPPSSRNTSLSRLVPPTNLATLLHALDTNRITRPAAVTILKQIYTANDTASSSPSLDGNLPKVDIRDLIAAVSTQSDLSPAEYSAMAKELTDANPQVVRDIKQKGQMGKLKWLLGQMMKRNRSDGTGKAVAYVEPRKAEAALRQVLGI